jgi:hypothetical protein
MMNGMINAKSLRASCNLNSIIKPISGHKILPQGLTYLREPLKIHVLSFLRKQESSKNNKIDSRFRGNDGLLDVPLN